MGDWKPEKELNLSDAQGAEYASLSQRLYLWTVPAKAAANRD